MIKVDHLLKIILFQGKIGSALQTTPNLDLNVWFAVNFPDICCKITACMQKKGKLALTI